MPSHPDRVRRNYHTIEIIEESPAQYYESNIHIKISKLDIASCMSKREVKVMVFKYIDKGIDNQYRF